MLNSRNDVEQKKGNLKSHHCEQWKSSSKKLKIDLPHDPAIPCRGTHPKEMKSEYQRDACFMHDSSELRWEIKRGACDD